MSREVRDFDSYFKVVQSKDICNEKDFEMIKSFSLDLISLGHLCVVSLSRGDEDSFSRCKVDGQTPWESLNLDLKVLQIFLSRNNFYKVKEFKIKSELVVEYQRFKELNPIRGLARMNF
jgi:hypothetical protein